MSASEIDPVDPGDHGDQGPKNPQRGAYNPQDRSPLDLVHRGPDVRALRHGEGD
jgi:hypothetical protein